ncbi:hypothetical protein GCM10010331_07690 [Streptomyces xanthochromogenes]|uniref:DUF4232 domain-containing protein n=1 Tax=Streptomyces xanthochromogenes TaxID=67384 RepID=UPI00167AA435|nr:DUF4232 domain-containing protein [Streptomyces xanthochromogenes]GHB23588.1 hypothetical protein GCM10010331_07690 [Streptomyces xanthochromogenes]
MKLTRIAALAALGVAATFSLTACNGDDSSNGQAAGSSSSSAPSAPATADSGSSDSSGSSGSSASSNGGSKSSGGGSTAGAGKSGSAKGSANGAVNGTSKSDGKTKFCKTQDLAIDAQNAAADKTSGRVNITMINRGSTTCSATGFAGVDIKDADHTSNPIPRGQAQPRITTLKPGDAAVFDLAYTIDSSGNSLSHPTNILVTPPNETHTITLNWPSGAGAVKGSYADVEVYPTHNTD